MAVTYCRRWNTKLGQPIEPCSEDEARHRFESGPWFTVVLDGESGAPRATIELEPQASVAKVFRFTASGSVELIEEYERRGDQLFMNALLAYTYADGARHRQLEATVIDTYRFQPDGVVHREYDDKSQPTVEVEDRRGVDVAPNWKPVPVFGDWESLARQPA